MIKVGVLGATGYAGIELVRLLTLHKEVELSVLGSQSFAGEKISDVYPGLRGVLDKECVEVQVDHIIKNCDVVFTALPHGASKEIIPLLHKGNIKIIDLSGDFRYNDPKVYEEWYGEPHVAVDLLAKSVYGLTEVYRDKIKNADLVGNPGCYTTCSILGALPLLKAGIVSTENIIIDAKSGVSGAGRATSLELSFCECTENTKAYKIGTHRHTSEIEQELSIAAKKPVMVSFTPHLVPIKRGILSTIYANLNTKVKTEDVISMYKEFYKDEYFIRVYDSGLPETNHVAGSNFVDIGIVVDGRLGRVIVVSAIDNLIKGAAGQAIQNMNVMFGFDEKEGIANAAFYL